MSSDHTTTDHEPPPSTSPETLDFDAWSSLVARAAAISVALCYGAGFVIVMLHHARLGIFDFDMLQPRIAYAGASFIGLTLLGAFSALVAFDRQGNPRHTLSIGAESGWLERSVWASSCLATFNASVAALVVYSVFFRQAGIPSPPPAAGWQAGSCLVKSCSRRFSLALR